MNKTYVLISYDISDDRTRTKLAKRLKDFGRRAQYSVFEAEITQTELIKLRKILGKVTLGKNDSIRLYKICAACTGNVDIWGSGELVEDPDFVII